MKERLFRCCVLLNSSVVVVVVVVVRAVEEEPAVTRGGGRDGGACCPQRAAAVGGNERVPPWSRFPGTRTCGGPVSAKPRQSWTATGNPALRTMPWYCCNCVINSACVCVRTLQGYLHMWVDMFPTDVPAPPPVDIKPRLPEQYVNTTHGTVERRRGEVYL